MINQHVQHLGLPLRQRAALRPGVLIAAAAAAAGLIVASVAASSTDESTAGAAAGVELSSLAQMRDNLAPFFYDASAKPWDSGAVMGVGLTDPGCRRR